MKTFNALQHSHQQRLSLWSDVRNELRPDYQYDPEQGSDRLDGVCKETDN